MSRRLRHPLAPIVVAVLLTLPWVFAWGSGVYRGFGDLGRVALAGLGVLGASFLLAWAAETAEKDVPRAFAIAVLAVLAVAPEYAVDALYAWGAGSRGATAQACADLAPGLIDRVATMPRTAIDTPAEHVALGCHEGNLAVANMTGANRILIGLGWAGIAMFTVWHARRSADPAVESRPGWFNNRVHLDRDIATEITFLALATLWAFLVPLGGGIDLLDMAVLVGIYVTYIGIIVTGDVEVGDHHAGVPAYLQSFRKSVRVPCVLLLFGYSGFLILTAVEPFAHGLEAVGVAIGVPAFFMIQWIAPLASESPELIVVAVLVYKSRSTAGFNALISSKLNQWTLLIGTLVVVYSIALGQYGTLPFDLVQSGEIWITAAQSYFALAVLVNFNISVREALALFVLFLSQVILEFVFLKLWAPFPDPKFELLMAYTAIYLVAGTAMFARRRGAVRELWHLTANAIRSAFDREPIEPTRGD